MTIVQLNFTEEQTHCVEQNKPLLIAHGLFGSGSNWRSIARLLAADRVVLSVDMRNHGDSPWASEHDYPHMVADLKEFILQKAGGSVSLLGHSMGGKAAMWLALTEPQMVDKLIIVDVAPVNYRHSHTSLISHMRAIDLTKISRRQQVEQLLQPAEPRLDIRRFLLKNLLVDQDKMRWRLNLSALEAASELIAAFPDPENRCFHGPTLIIRGGNSRYVDDAAQKRIFELFPGAQIETIEDTDHWPHAQKPDLFANMVAEYLQK